MIISFGWTTPALLAGAKTATRRIWTDRHAAHFKADMLVDAWNTSPRNVHMSPRKVATIRLTAAPRIESTGRLRDADWYAEGFRWMEDNTPDARIDGLTPRQLWSRWIDDPGQRFYVVRFEVVEYLEGPLA